LRFEHGAAVAAKWKKLGAETKRLLYRDPGCVAELDKFFRLARLTARNANPSGMAHAIAAGHAIAEGTALLAGTIEPMTAVATIAGPAAVSKFLRSPVGVRLLSKGIRIPLGNKTARAAWVAQVAKFATEQGFAPWLPATAEDIQPATESPIGRRW
jgi:hypothetical protein